MTRRPFGRHLVALLGAGLCALSPALARAQTAPPRYTGRASFFTNTARTTIDAERRPLGGDFVSSITFGSVEAEGDGVELGVDMRQSQYLDASREARVSVYDAFAGGRFAGGRIRARAGQMWMVDLGGLGALVGGLVEYRQKLAPSQTNRFRAGVFAGVEPNGYTFGYVQGIRKRGGYGVLEGRGGRRHVAGFVDLRHGPLTERSVLTTTNFVPIKGKAFFYQAAEYDLRGPGGEGHRALSYFMVNARVSVSSRVELQSLYHRGRSIDARTITDDLLNGRPLTAGALEGFLFQSTGGRATIRVAKDLRVYGGYSQDKNSRDSARTGRIQLGASSSNLARTGIDLTVTESRITRPTGNFSSFYTSIGRQVGRKVYLSGDVSTSLSIVRFTRADGITVEMRPRTRQVGVSTVVQMGRHLSLFATGERTTDETLSELRVLSGLTYRFR